MTKFPQKLFVKLANTGSGLKEDEYWQVAEDCVDLADESSGLIDVGVYELVSKGKLATQTQFIADKAKRRK